MVKGHKDCIGFEPVAGIPDAEEKRDIVSDSPTGSATEQEPAVTVRLDPATAVQDFPDGGWLAWVQVLGSWAAMVMIWGLVSSFGVFQTYYETTLLLGDPQGTSSAISWIGSLQGSLLLTMGCLSGPLYDAGYFRHLVVAGVLLILLGQFLTSLCTVYWQLMLAQGVAIGIGNGLMFLPTTAILAQYFRRRRALAIGLSSSGSPFGGIIFPILFAHLRPRIGFGWTMRVIAFILLGLAVVPVAFMRVRPTASTTKKTETPRQHRRLFDPSALRDPPFFLMVIGNFLNFLCLYVPYFYIQLFAERRGIYTAAFGPSYHVTMINVGSVIGRLLPNTIADHVGSMNMLVVCNLICVILVGGWMGISSLSAHSTDSTDNTGHLASLIAFDVLYGLFSGGIVSLMPSQIMHLAPRPELVGTRMGMSFFATGISLLVGPPIAGAILGDGTDDKRWMAQMGFCMAGILLAFAFNTLSRVFSFKRDRILFG